VLPRIAHLLSPRHEPVVQLGKAGDAVGFGLAEESFADEAIEPLLFAAALGLSG